MIQTFVECYRFSRVGEDLSIDCSNDMQADRITYIDATPPFFSEIANGNPLNEGNVYSCQNYQCSSADTKLEPSISPPFKLRGSHYSQHEDQDANCCSGVSRILWRVYGYGGEKWSEGLWKKKPCCALGSVHLLTGYSARRHCAGPLLPVDTVYVFTSSDTNDTPQTDKTRKRAVRSFCERMLTVGIRYQIRNGAKGQQIPLHIIGQNFLGSSELGMTARIASELDFYLLGDGVRDFDSETCAAMVSDLELGLSSWRCGHVRSHMPTTGDMSNTNISNFLITPTQSTQGTSKGANTLWLECPSKWLHRAAVRFGDLGSINLDSLLSQSRQHNISQAGRIDTHEETATTGPLYVTSNPLGDPIHLTTQNQQAKALKNPGGDISIEFEPLSIYILLIKATLNYLYNTLTPVINSTLNPPAPPVFVFSMRADAPVSPIWVSEETILAWRAAISGLPAITISGIEIKNPKVAHLGPPEASEQTTNVNRIGVVSNTEPIVPSIHSGPTSVSAPGSLPPPEGFVLTGHIALFGVQDITAQLEVWKGPTPVGITLQGNEPLSIERATLAGNFCLSSLLPDLKGSAFDNMVFRNVSFYHQNYPFDVTKAVGWHMNADLVVDESCGMLYQVLSKVLGVRELLLSVHAGLGLDGGWERQLQVHSFTLEGVFARVSTTPMDGIRLTTIGVRLYGIRTMKYSPQPHTVLEYAFGVFGGMHLDVSGCVVPLGLDYEIRESSGTLHIAADVSGETWHIGGLNAFQLSNVSFATFFPVQTPWRSITFDISASLSHKFTQAYFAGSYAASGAFELSADIQEFDTSTISDLFDHVSGGQLAIPDVPIAVEAAAIKISSAKGLEMSLERVNVGGHVAVDATLTIASRSVLLRGGLGNDVIEFGDTQVKNPFLQVLFETADSGKRTDVIIGGQVDFSGLTFSAAVHLYPAEDRSGGSEWTVLAALTAANDSIPLSKIVPEVGGTFLDFALTQVTFAAASRDNPSLGNMITSGYNFHQGVQICATLGQIEPLNALMRRPVPGLVLTARWSKATGFDLNILLPTPTSLSFGNGLMTTPVELGIQTNPVQLVLSAGLNVPVAHTLAPLLFTISLVFNATGATATGEMAGWWVNPFGISPNVKVGPNLAISTDIIFASFVATGLPSGFGIHGGMMIGKTSAQFVLSTDEDPMRQMLHAELRALDLPDITSFAGDIVGVPIPEPPRDLLHFEDLKVYICPAPITLGTVTYPQGFSIGAAMIIFEKRADISCAITSGEVVIKGDLDNFELGPLVIRGSAGPRAVLECVLGPLNQHLMIDGVATVFDTENNIHIQVELLPQPKFAFHFSLGFTDMLTFKVNANLIGTLSFAGIHDADFALDAQLGQQILQYIHNQIMIQFDKVRQAAEGHIPAMHMRFDDAKKASKNRLDQAQAHLDAASRAWNEKTQDVTNASHQLMENYTREVARRQLVIQQAQIDYNRAVNVARQAVQDANNERTHQMATAQHAVDDARRDMVQSISAAQGALDTATADMRREFGHPALDIERARKRVQSLGHELDGLWNTAHDSGSVLQPGFHTKLAVPGLLAGIGSANAAKDIANGTLRGAEAQLTSPNYLARQGAVQSAQQTLHLAQTNGSLALEAAKETLHKVDIATQAAVNVANNALQSVKSGPEFRSLNVATQALNAYQEANIPSYKAAEAAINKLSQSIEFEAFQRASSEVAAAKRAAAELEMVEATLRVAGTTGDEALAVGKWIVDHQSKLLDIRTINVSGTLRGIVGHGGAISKPLKAHVEGVILDKPFGLDTEFDPRRPADFITSTFESLWNVVIKQTKI